jgi:hypothetical protein
MPHISLKFEKIKAALSTKTDKQNDLLRGDSEMQQGKLNREREGWMGGRKQNKNKFARCIANIKHRAPNKLVMFIM